MERFALFEDLLTKWNDKINLVSSTTLPDYWTRHVLDSAQLFKLAPPSARTWADLGSGGGFPALVIAILANEMQPTLRMSLVESDKRKVAFLRTASRELDLKVQIHAERIEDVERLGSDVVSARALSPLPKLLHYVERHMKPTGTALLHKGTAWQREVEEARRDWRFISRVHQSICDSDAVVLEIGVLTHG
jgi:16S rRNA (guanine527-N7)-methyltransferase